MWYYSKSLFLQRSEKGLYSCVECKEGYKRKAAEGENLKTKQTTDNSLTEYAFKNHTELTQQNSWLLTNLHAQQLWDCQNLTENNVKHSFFQEHNTTFLTLKRKKEDIKSGINADFLKQWRQRSTFFHAAK